MRTKIALSLCLTLIVLVGYLQASRSAARRTATLVEALDGFEAADARVVEVVLAMRSGVTVVVDGVHPPIASMRRHVGALRTVAHDVEGASAGFESDLEALAQHAERRAELAPRLGEVLASLAVGRIAVREARARLDERCATASRPPGSATALPLVQVCLSAQRTLDAHVDATAADSREAVALLDVFLAVPSRRVLRSMRAHQRAYERVGARRARASALGMLGLMVAMGVALAGLFERLEASRRTILESNDKLTATVQERTGELRSANEQLRRDIEIRDELERERSLMEVQLRHAQKLEAVGRMAAGIAHEINTPMQFIGDNARFVRDVVGDIGTLHESLSALLAGEADPKPPWAESVAAACEEADLDFAIDESSRAMDDALEGVAQVSEIVRAMKEFSHPGAASRAAIDVNRAVETTLAVARNEWKYLAEVETDLDPSLPDVLGFASELNQALLNLVVNAAHAIRGVVGDSGELGRIAVKTRATGDAVVVTIADTGGGIPADVRDRVFEPFFTTKQVGDGTGQGLAIAYAVVVGKHGGELSFESEPGRGTTFRIVLPLTKEERAEEAEPVAEAVLTRR